MSLEICHDAILNDFNVLKKNNKYIIESDLHKSYLALSLEISST